MTDAPKCYQFITGRLAQHAVENTVQSLATKLGFTYSIQVLPITVAALMNARWLLRHLVIQESTDCIVLPGYLDTELEAIRQALDVDVEVGPKDIRDLPMFFGQKVNKEGYGSYDIEILAEINHADRLGLEALIQQAQDLARAGADLIDLGCSPDNQWDEIEIAVSELKNHGLRVSVDSFNPHEVSLACSAGAELVLSVNSKNMHACLDWGVEVVAIPDSPGDQKSFEKTIDFLTKNSVKMRLDPILEPIGCGFAESLQRYAKCRQDYPDAELMMGIGNITELTDADSAGINVLLLGICQELGIRSVLTTQVINWARSSVQECDLARRLVHFACTARIPPKHIEPSLVTLRDPRVAEPDTISLDKLAQQIRDKNIRISCHQGNIHAVSAGTHVKHEDPFRVMDLLLETELGQSITPAHAFYLGYEMAKAHTANTLGKQYTQDEALNWGYLTQEEKHHRLARTHRAENENR